MCVRAHAPQVLQVYMFMGERECVCVCVCVCVCPLKVLQVYMFTGERECVCVHVPGLHFYGRVCVCVYVCWEALGTGPGCLLGGCAACILAQ